MVRQIYDGALPKDMRRNYGGAFDGLKKIMGTEGGIAAMWKGFGPYALKSIVLNASFYFYSLFFHYFKYFMCFFYFLCIFAIKF